MGPIDALQARFNYWLEIERAAFKRRNKALGCCTFRYAAIYAGRSQQNPSAVEVNEFDLANDEWQTAKSAIDSVIRELREL
jgi:hypothetical protein